MSPRELSLAVREVIVSALGCPPARAVDNAELRSLNSSEARTARLFDALRARFAVSISPREAAFCETVGTVIDLIETKLERGSALDRRRA